LAKSVKTVNTKEEKVGTKRNYQFVQFLLDIFGVFLLYLVTIAIVEDIVRILRFNEQIRVEGAIGEAAKANPYPLIVWGVLALLIYVAGIVLPLIYVRKTRFSQKQFDMWVYAVLLIRVLALITVFELMAKHIGYIMRAPESLFSLTILMNVVLIAILVRFTQFRIRKAEPQKEGKIKITFTED
jgi:uncharacterized membrane protein